MNERQGNRQWAAGAEAAAQQLDRRLQSPSDGGANAVYPCAEFSPKLWIEITAVMTHVMSFEVCRTIPADHPSLPGHFPDTPIVPGVVILDEVVAALAEWRGGAHISAIPTVKFLAPLKPEQPFTIYLTARGVTDKEFDFSCRAEDRLIVQGRLQVRPSARATDS